MNHDQPRGQSQRQVSKGVQRISSGRWTGGALRPWLRSEPRPQASSPVWRRFRPTTRKSLVGPLGFEPRTDGLKVRCSDQTELKAPSHYTGVHVACCIEWLGQQKNKPYKAPRRLYSPPAGQMQGSRNLKLSRQIIRGTINWPRQLTLWYIRRGGRSIAHNRSSGR